MDENTETETKKSLRPNTHKPANKSTRNTSIQMYFPLDIYWKYTETAARNPSFVLCSEVCD